MWRKWNRLALPVVLLLLFPLSGRVWAGRLEPFKGIPVVQTNPQTPEKIELGKELFFDRRLSGDGTMSCATCHIPEQAFTDGQEISLSYPTTKSWRNTPTLVNVALSAFLFHDGRAQSLEEQALPPIVSPFEMNQNLDFLEEELESVPEYVERFKRVFGTNGITRARIAMAIASFERTLISRNSPLDRYLEGDQEALSGPARKGLAIFTGKAGCSRCHYGVNLVDEKFHALRVPENPKLLQDPRMTATLRFTARMNGYEDFRSLTVDPGRFLITKDRKDWRAFKTPTLRDIAKTGPYMHDGVFQTLDQVIDFFDRGGGEGNTLLQPLGLSLEEKQDLKAFLIEGLSGEETVVAPPDLP